MYKAFKSQDTYEEMSFANMSIIALIENCPFCVRVHFREAEFPDPVEFLSSVKQHDQASDGVGVIHEYTE